MASDDAFDRLIKAWETVPLFSANEHGLWCINCGDLIAPIHWFENEDFVPRETCKACGFDGVREGEAP